MDSHNNLDYFDRSIDGPSDGSNAPNAFHTASPESSMPPLPKPRVFVSPNDDKVPADKTDTAANAAPIVNVSASQPVDPGLRPTPSPPKTAFMWFSLSKTTGNEKQMVSVNILFEIISLDELESNKINK